jgi:hypothetical protein
MVAVQAMLRAAIHPDSLSLSAFIRFTPPPPRDIAVCACKLWNWCFFFFLGGTGESFRLGRPAADPKVASICVWVRAMA